MDPTSISNAWIKRLTMITLIMLLPACQSADTSRFGGLLGSVAGSIGASYLGGYLGGGTAGNIIAAVAGGVGGYYVGSTIGGCLGKGDKQSMAQASQTAFNTGQPQTFSNSDTGLEGYSSSRSIATGGAAGRRMQDNPADRRSERRKNGD
ncbi:MAG: hypothetical protein ABI167_12950 [Nitrosospira sp.]